MNTELSTPRYASDEDFPYTYLIKKGCLYKTTKKPNKEAQIFPDLPTAHIHLLPDLAGDLQGLNDTRMFDSQFERNVRLRTEKFAQQFTLTSKDIKQDGTFIVQHVTTPDAILPSVWELVEAQRVPKGTFRTLPVGKSQKLVIFRKSDGYVIGFEGDEEGIYLIYRKDSHIFFYKGSELEGGEELTQHAIKFLGATEKALSKTEKTTA